jgi:hypothetical protein
VGRGLLIRVAGEMLERPQRQTRTARSRLSRYPSTGRGLDQFRFVLRGTIY